MTYKEALTIGKEQLGQAGIEEASLDAWLLLEHVTGKSRAYYFLHENDEMDLEQVISYRKVIAKRAEHIPLQHLTGVQEFMGLNFLVNEHVLIPRQDTEVLVEEASKWLRSDMRVLDMCTGSGCIIISLTDEANKQKLNAFESVGADISPKALEVAKENAKRLHTDVTFVQSDLFAQIEGTFDLIVSNPPYIRTDVIAGLQKEVKMHDPFIALDGKEDGLFFYKKIAEESCDYINDGGRLYFEIGHDQGEDVSNLMKACGYDRVKVKKDLAGLDRIVFGEYNKKDEGK